ncbi:MAG: amino acid-binding protein, partial [Deltaproteobacteria bacterium]|nr:amino acid-binding protein [Deltaproteobacteria bacterium]
MVRQEISLFLRNVPGELGRLAAMFGEAGINIDAITIQDASAYVQELFKARGKSLKRIASAASYNSMRKDSVEFALIRLLAGDTEKAVELLSQN